MMMPYVLLGITSDQVTLMELGNSAAADTDVGGAPGTEIRNHMVVIDDNR